MTSTHDPARPTAHPLPNDATMNRVEGRDQYRKTIVWGIAGATVALSSRAIVGLIADPDKPAPTGLVATIDYLTAGVVTLAAVAVGVGLGQMSVGRYARHHTANQATRIGTTVGISVTSAALLMLAMQLLVLVIYPHGYPQGAAADFARRLDDVLSAALSTHLIAGMLLCAGLVIYLAITRHKNASNN